MRRMLERISPVLFVAVASGGFVVASALPAAAIEPDERRDRLHAVRPIAAPIEGRATFLDPDVAAQVELAHLAEQAQIDAYFADLEAERIEAQRARSGSGWAVTAAVGSGSCGGDAACFLECTRAHESDTSGGYSAVSSGGTYRGAYQFLQATWDAAVAGAGHEEFAGVPADEAPPAVQDAAAAHLYSVSGTRPWGGRC